LLVAAALALAAPGCNGGLGGCDEEPDLTGSWALSFTPLSVDGGMPPVTIPRPVEVTADLMQVKNSSPFAIGRLIWGMLSSTDSGFFGTLTIPPLMNNDGSKTGAELGCTLKINVPIAMPVIDNSDPQGPLRLGLVGQIDVRGHMNGSPSSTVIMMDDLSATPRHFAWTGAQQ
jgi:hypothetical protein